MLVNSGVACSVFGVSLGLEQVTSPGAPPGMYEELVEFSPRVLRLQPGEWAYKARRFKSNDQTWFILAAYFPALEIPGTRDAGFYGAAVWLLNGETDKVESCLRIVRDLSRQVAELAVRHGQFHVRLTSVADRIRWPLDEMKALRDTMLPAHDNVGLNWQSADSILAYVHDDGSDELNLWMMLAQKSAYLPRARDMIITRRPSDRTPPATSAKEVLWSPWDWFEGRISVADAQARAARKELATELEGKAAWAETKARLEGRLADAEKSLRMAHSKVSEADAHAQRLTRDLAQAELKLSSLRVQFKDAEEKLRAAQWERESLVEDLSKARDELHARQVLASAYVRREDYFTPLGTPYNIVPDAKSHEEPPEERARVATQSPQAAPPETKSVISPNLAYAERHMGKIAICALVGLCAWLHFRYGGGSRGPEPEPRTQQQVQQAASQAAATAPPRSWLTTVKSVDSNVKTEIFQQVHPGLLIATVRDILRNTTCFASASEADVAALARHLQEAERSKRGIESVNGVPTVEMGAKLEIPLPASCVINSRTDTGSFLVEDRRVESEGGTKDEKAPPKKAKAKDEKSEKKASKKRDQPASGAPAPAPTAPQAETKPATPLPSLGQDESR